MRDDKLSWTLIYTSQEATQHDGIGASGDSLGDITRVLNTTICNNRHTMLTGEKSTVINRGDLWHPNTRDNASRANSTCTDTYFHSVCSCLDKGLSCLGCHDIAHDQLHLSSKTFFYLRHRFNDHARVSVGGIYYQHIHSLFDQGGTTSTSIWSYTDCGPNTQATIFVFGSMWVENFLLDILHGDKALEHSVLIHHRQFLDLIAMEAISCLL